MRIVAFLQNAWSPFYAGGIWPRDSWLKALRKSRSGQRLKVFDELNIWWDNTTPIVGDNPNSVIKPDRNHIDRVMVNQNPDYVIAFGKQAEKALTIDSFYEPLLILPHPACRVVTNLLYEDGIKILLKGFKGTKKLWM